MTKNIVAKESFYSTKLVVSLLAKLVPSIRFEKVSSFANASGALWMTVARVMKVKAAAAVGRERVDAFFALLILVDDTVEDARLRREIAMVALVVIEDALYCRGGAVNDDGRHTHEKEECESGHFESRSL